MAINNSHTRFKSADAAAKIADANGGAVAGFVVEPSKSIADYFVVAVYNVDDGGDFVFNL